VSAGSVREPHVRITLRVRGEAVATFSSEEQKLFTKGAATAMKIFPERVLLESVEDVKSASLATTGASSYLANSTLRRLLQQSVPVSEIVVTLRITVEKNEDTRKVADDFEKLVTDGALTKNLETLGLKGLEITTEGRATQFQSVSTIIFKNPDFLVALVPAGFVLMLSGIVGACSAVTRYLQQRNETKTKMNKNLAQLSLAPGQGPSRRTGSIASTRQVQSVSSF